MTGHQPLSPPLRVSHSAGPRGPAPDSAPCNIPRPMAVGPLPILSPSLLSLLSRFWPHLCAPASTPSQLGEAPGRLLCIAFLSGPTCLAHWLSQAA